MIAGPTLLLAVLLLAAGAIYLLRRFEPLAALLAAFLAALLAFALWRLPLAAPVRVAGREVSLGQAVAWQDLTLQITPATVALLVFLLGTAAVAFVLAWRTYQGRTFYPFGLALVALWAVAAMLQPLTFTPLAMILASILAVFLIQAGKAGETRGAWRQLLFPTLAAPLFAVAMWYMDQAPLNPDDQTPFRIAAWLLIAGFVLLLQPAPLHVAIPAVAGQAPPVVAAFLWIGGQATTLFLLQRFLVAYPWLAATVDSARWLLWLGVFTATVGGALTATQRTLGRFAGYAGLYDYGVLLVAMGLRGTAGLPTAIWLLLTRTLALLTLATGAALIRHHMESDRLERIAGAASRLPLSVAALVMGGFALAGMPLTAQFASRWALLQLAAEDDPRWTALLLLGALGVLIGTLRAGRACFGNLSGSPVEREPAGLALLALGLVVAGALLGVFPQFLTGPVAAVILPLSTLGP
ncbi:MAG: proton-conducting transporter membrane subunit [Chloroflexi bacterium]|nr:proton-conducting transporter membrane subunit [Chloroflexota bacterium]